MKNLLKLAKQLFKPSNSFNGWQYDYEKIGKGIQAVTITNPDGQALRPVLLPRPGFDWFTHG